MLLEGLIPLYERMGTGAKDRVDRAQFLSLAIGDSELVAITSAWKAHIEFETSKFEQMIQSLGAALSRSTNDSHEAVSRAAMTVANVHYICGERELAQAWFMLSREHALALGDQAGIDALLYNRAAFGLARIRAMKCMGRLDRESLSAVGMEIASAKNFQALVQIEALQNFVYLCEARLLMLSEDFAGAYQALDQVRSRQPFAAYNFSQPLIDLELAYCSLNLGMKSVASSHFSLAQGADFSDLDLDERLVVQWLRTELSRSDASFGALTDEQEKLDGLVQEYTDSTDSLTRSMSELRTPPSNVLSVR